MSVERRQVARTINRRIEERANELARNRTRLGVVRGLNPLKVELLDGGKQELRENHNLTLSWAVEQYDKQHGIDKGDNVLIEKRSGDWVASDVISDVEAKELTRREDHDALAVSVANKQPLHSNLTAISGLTIPAYGLEFLELADAAAARAHIGAQPLSDDLTAIDLLTTTGFGRGLLELDDAAAGRAMLDVPSTADVEPPDLGAQFWTASSPRVETVATANTIYFARIVIPAPCTLTGVAWNNGTVTSGNVKVMLFDAGGTRVAISAGAATGVANAQRQEPFTSPYDAEPGVYYGGIVFSSGSHRFYGDFPPVPSSGFLNSSYATPATSITPPTTANFAPALSTY